MQLKYSIGDIVKVSKEICETEYLKIWGIDESPPHQARTKRQNWDYAVRCIDPQSGISCGISFTLNEDEIICAASLVTKTTIKDNSPMPNVNQK